MEAISFLLLGAGIGTILGALLLDVFTLFLNRDIAHDISFKTILIKLYVRGIAVLSIFAVIKILEQ